MGVLSDGTAYLTGRGLARMCGIDQKSVVQMTQAWNDAPLRPREAKIRETLKQQGYDDSVPYLTLKVDGTTHYAFPDAVCMAVLEYYAFDAGLNAKEQARKNYRLLARRSFREFIYTQVGYKPAQSVPVSWQQFHDRVSLVYHTVPAGYFSVFKEIADVIVTLIRGGAVVDEHFVPDISVGQHWAKHWITNGFDQEYGPRVVYEHNYPAYFPQAVSNPQTPYCYPDAALGEFRRWVRDVYLVEKLPAYLLSKEKQGALPPAFTQAALKALEGPKAPALAKAS